VSRVVVVDIGNTSTAVGLVRNGRLAGTRHVRSRRRSQDGVLKVVHDVAGKRPIDGTVLCSVVPRLGRTWRAALRKLSSADPLVVDHKLDLGVAIDYPKPTSIGGDRLANACGAVSRYGAPAIVADFGTALTFDVISAERAYVGGVIAPGLPFMTDYLAEKAALLPHIRLHGRYGAVGKSTAGAMRLGAKVGYRGMVREIVKYLESNLGLRKARLCATGGYAEWALEGLDIPFTVDPELTLHGLTEIYKRNCGGQE